MERCCLWFRISRHHSPNVWFDRCMINGEREHGGRGATCTMVFTDLSDLMIAAILRMLAKVISKDIMQVQRFT